MMPCEEQETNNGLKYYKMQCRYLDYNGQVFGEASINLTIVKFCIICVYYSYLIPKDYVFHSSSLRSLP